MSGVWADKRIALAAGGTGGHVYPALAVLRALLEHTPPPAEVSFFGRKSGLERRLVEPLPVKYIGLSLTGLPRRVSYRWITSPLLALGAFLKIAGEFFIRRPHLVIGFGSYVAAPVVLAALCLRIPTIIHEQNTFPGLANRRLAPWVTRVLVSDSQTPARLRRADAKPVGIPLRTDVVGAKADWSALGLTPERKTLLIFGGSQGARRICQTVPATLRQMEHDLADWQVLLITGPGNYEAVKSEPLPENVIVRPYVEAMGAAYAVADLAVARAGAVSLAELTANGVPCVLVPLPIAAGGHQARNAHALESRGAACVIDDAVLNPQTLADQLRQLIGNPQRLGEMAQAARSLGQPDATKKFIEEMESLLEQC